MQIRRIMVQRDTIYSEGGLPAVVPVTRVSACAVIHNPLAGKAGNDISVLLPFGEELGALLVKEALAVLPGPAVSYGKAAIVGSDGEIEHAAVLLHPRMGKPIRAAVGGGKAIITSNVKVAGVGAEIDVPLTDKDDVWNFDRIDTMTVSLPGAPRANEVVVIIAISDGGRPCPRVKAGGLKTTSD